MNKKSGFIPYDGFKLVVAIILLIIIFGLWMTSTNGKGAPPPPMVEENAEIAEASPTQAPPPTPQPTEAVEEEVKLPPFPEPSDGLSYDVESGFVVDADGNPLYQLSEDGTGWIPIVPDEMQSMELSAEGEEWILSDDEGKKYAWDAATHSWVEVPQEEVAEEAASTVECEGAAPSQLISGGEAEVLSNVNFRSSPGVGDNWIATLQSGSRLKVLGETACIPYGSGAYLWWLLEREDGSTGWTAEAPITSANYFIQPVE